MSRNSSINNHASSFSSYSGKDMILSEDEEECATLAEPMTLEGAKQLAQSSNGGVAAAPTPTSSLSYILPTASPTSHVHLATPSPSLHHLSSPPLTSHNQRSTMHSLASPSHSSTPIPSHLTSPLASPSPHPHLGPLHHHDHNLWVSSSVSHDEGHEVEDLPSTVDIQAIRDSPSPDPSAGKLVTINENWDTVEEDQNSVEVCDGSDEDSEDDDKDNDSDSNLSESDSNLSDNSSKSLLSVHESQKKSIQGSPKVCCANFSRSRSVSESSCNSKSDESDSQDSDSDTSDVSTSEEDSSSSNLKDDELDIQNSVNNKPLPRIKPQLTASTLQFSKRFTEASQREKLKGKCSNEIEGNETTKRKFDNESPLIEMHHTPVKESYTTDETKIDNRTIKSEVAKSSPPCHILVNKNSFEDTCESFKPPKLSENTPSKMYCPIKRSNQNLLENSDDNNHKRKDLEKLNEASSSMQELKINGDSPSSISKTKENGNTDEKVEYLHSEKSKESTSEKNLNHKCSVEELKERRLKNKLLMEKEFNRLLKSSKPVVSSKESKGTEASFKRLFNVDYLKGKKKADIDSKIIHESALLRNNSLGKKMSENIVQSPIKNKTKYEPNQKSDLHTSKLTKTSSHMREEKTLHDADSGNNFKSTIDVSNCKLLYYSSDSKSNYPSCSSSSQSSDSEDSSLLKPTKRYPSLNVTAKPISNTGSKCHSRPLESSKRQSQVKGITGEQSSLSNKSKTDKYKAACDNNPNKVRPTIADIVKVRERRSSIDKDTSSSNESGRKMFKFSSKFYKLDRHEDETASSSEASDDLNEKVDLDTETTQTFSVSENNFNQGRLTMKIAAMKMAKFGKTGLREVTNGGLPTRSDLHLTPPVNMSCSTFKRPKIIPYCKGNAVSAGPSVLTASRSEPHKVKTAAERKTYVDALPPCGSMCTLKARRKKGIKSDMRVPVSSACRPGLCIHGIGAAGFPSGSQSQHFHYYNHSSCTHNNEEDEEQQISIIAQHLSQISHDHNEGLQVLDQEDLAAILPDVNNVGPPPESATSVPLDPFPVHLGSHNKSDSEDMSVNEEPHTAESEDLPELCVREAILLSEENALPQLNNVLGDTLYNNANPRSHTPLTKYARVNANHKSDPSFKHSDEQYHEKKKTSKLKVPSQQTAADDDSENPSMPELESYVNLDCNGSNVSPDSGIQSVSGSPLHQIGSPSHHHSPYYSNGSAVAVSGGSSNSNNESLLIGRSCNDSGSSSNGNLRSLSPSLSFQDSPPPPTLLPAVTPPHMMGSPRCNYDDSPNSPPMPSLKCQVDPPPWEEKNSDASPLQEQGAFNEKGPGRPKDVNVCDALIKPKRPRGRPKGSKNRRKAEADGFGIKRKKKTVESFIKEPSNALAKLHKISEDTTFNTSGLDYSSMKHKWRGSNSDPDDLPSINAKSNVPLKRGPGRPKKRPPVLEIQTQSKDERSSFQPKPKQPVGRPRKYPKIPPPVDNFNRPVTLASKKCFSEKIMHKIINENVRNSEKSDKLSVQSFDGKIISENGRSSEKSDKLSIQPVKSYSEKLKTVTANPLFVDGGFSKDKFENFDERNKCNVANEDRDTGNKENRKKKALSDGIPLDDKKKKRGRKKELPAIFEKVYGNIKNINLKGDINKCQSSESLLNKNKKKKKKHKKQFKTKHKNIVDPVFLAEVEELIAGVQKCFISRSSPLQFKSGDDVRPSIFKIRKVTFSVKKRRGNEKTKSSDKESGTEGENNKEKIAGKRKKKLQEIPKQGKERSEANEQRLPLKKRHRHISTAVPTSPDHPSIDGNKGDYVSVKVPLEKDKPEFKEKTSGTKSPIPPESIKLIKTESRLRRISGETLDKESDYPTSEKNLSENVSLKEGGSVKESSVIAAVDPLEDKFCIIPSLKELPVDSNKKLESSMIPNLVTTTPKKRHRLEAELASTTVIAPTITTVASLTTTVTTNVINSVPSTIIPSLSCNKPPFPASKIKQEKDAKNKEVSGKAVLKYKYTLSESKQPLKIKETINDCKVSSKTVSELKSSSRNKERVQETKLSSRSKESVSELKQNSKLSESINEYKTPSKVSDSVIDLKSSSKAKESNNDSKSSSKTKEQVSEPKQSSKSSETISELKSVSKNKELVNDMKTTSKTKEIFSESKQSLKLKESVSGDSKSKEVTIVSKSREAVNDSKLSSKSKSTVSESKCSSKTRVTNNQNGILSKSKEAVLESKLLYTSKDNAGELKNLKPKDAMNDSKISKIKEVTKSKESVTDFIHEINKVHEIKQLDESKCVVVIEKCGELDLLDNKKSLPAASNILKKKDQEEEEVSEICSLHSDSDIPSEHEPLCESDQSGFMSDKEEPKEPPKRIGQKRRKKKRELRSPKTKQAKVEKTTDPLIEQETVIPKKKTKRRKTNKTGFPTIRKRKKKKSESEDKKDTELNALSNKNEENETENMTKLSVKSDSNNLINNSICAKSSDNKMDMDDINWPRPRGRPKKVITDQSSNNSITKDLREILRERKNDKSIEKCPPPKNESDITANLQRILEKVANGRSRRKRDLSEESSKIFRVYRKRTKLGDEEPIEDSDSNLISSECPMSSEPASSDESSRSFRGRKKVPRWRKRYLVAGLLSNYYKQDEPRKNGEMTTGKYNKLNYEPENHIHGLLPPPAYCKKWLRERQVDFLLPYDLWWLHVHSMLPGRDLVPSWNFKRVKSNIYYDVKLPNHDSEMQACNCKRPKSEEKGCSDDCINRMMFIECSPQTCPVKEHCSNQRIQRHESISCLQRFMTNDKGWGIKCTLDIRQGTFIMEYVGEVVSEKEFKHRMQTKYSNDTHHYCLNLDRGTVIDGHRMGGDCRFVNHSCYPNCEMQKWFVNGQYRMALFALKDIKADEELTYDYNFSLFNPTEGQSCKCGADNCRGVIGGRSQRVNVQPLEEKKKANGRIKKEFCKKRKRGVSTDTEGSCGSKSSYPIKPLSHQQRLYILAHRCFLLRNLEKVKRSRERCARIPDKKIEEIPEPPEEEPSNKIQKFLTHFTALNTARSVKTRRLAQAEDDPEMTKVAKLAQIFKDIYDKLVASRDEKEKPLATPFMTLPSKKKYPNYYTRIGEPIDLATIEKNILTGYYMTADSFDRDIVRLFANNLRFFSRNTDVGQMALGLRKVYSECKLQFKPLLEEVLGEEQLPQAFAHCSANEEFEEEDVIRCVCNLHRDEGMMIQCEQCLVWQHCDCMGVTENDSPEQYHCEECSPRLVSPEVPMTPQPADSPKDKYFITLLRDNLQIKLGDSVYILRDRPPQKSGERRQSAYKLAKDVKSHDLLIFKVENLWIDEKGDKFAFGHHYLMPHETYHEPWRKFFPNEVFRSPICDIIALDMIVNHCWVMDINSYCRGRPIGAIEEHVYVCEFRVDKNARVFSKISKPKYPICTKPFAFITFSHKLRPQRTYAPHEVTSSGRKIPPKNCPVSAPNSSTTVKEAIPSDDLFPLIENPIVEPTERPPTRSSSCNSSRANSGTRKGRSSSLNKTNDGECPNSESAPLPLTSIDGTASVKTIANNLSASQRAKKRIRVNSVATKLLNEMPSKGVVDLAYLLDKGKRLRKKTSAFAS